MVRQIMLIPAGRRDSQTGFKNVSYNPHKNKYQVKVKVGTKQYSLGLFSTAEEAQP